MKKESKRPIIDGSNPAQRKATSNAYLKYSGMAFQMGITILIGALLGRQLDRYMHTPQPWFTVVCSLLAIFAALYISLKDFMVKGDKNQGAE